MYAWFDKVFILKDGNFKFNKWDIIQNWEWYSFLVLWENISFPEIYNTIYSSDKNFKKIYQSLLSDKTIELIHRMVYVRYTTYKNVIKYFLDQEVEKLISKEIKPNKKKKYYNTTLWKTNITINWNHQILIVFPDIRTYNSIIWKGKWEWIFLYSLDTQNVKNTNRWKIKTWNENLIYSTSSEIFQNYSNLKEIFFIEPQKRYYAAQQDPRYKVGTVLEKIAEIYNSKITIINSENIQKK